MISLRKWREEDAQGLQRQANDPAIAAMLRDVFPSPYGIEDAEAFIAYASSVAPDKEIAFAVEVDGEVAGGASLVMQDDVSRYSAEIGYWLGREYWGQGIATEAVKQLLDIAFGQCGLKRVFGDVYAHNIASQRVLEKNGFSREGIMKAAAYKGGVFRDVAIYGITKPVKPELRRATAEDYEGIAEIMAQVHQLHVDARPDVYCPGSPWSREVYNEMLADETLLPLVAVWEGRLAGMCFTYLRPLNNAPGHVARKKAHIDTLAVHEELRGKGLGKALQTETMVLAKAQGYSCIDLQVGSFNEAAIAFYRNMGMKPSKIVMEIDL